MKNNISLSFILVLISFFCLMSLNAVCAENMNNTTDNNSFNTLDNISNDSALSDTDYAKFQGNNNNTGQSNCTGPQTNNTTWNVSVSGVIDGSPAIGADGTIYVGSWIMYNNDGYLYAFNSNGTFKWKYNTGGIVSTPAIGADGTIYVGTKSGIFYAFNPDGSVKWRYSAGFTNYIESSPAIGADGTIYVGIDNLNQLIAFNPDGSVKWSCYVDYPYKSSPAIGADGTIYIGSIDYKLYAINPNGTLKWAFNTSDRTFISSPAIGADGTIYIGCDGGILYAINPDGSLKWSYDGLGDVGGAITIASDGTIYFGTGDEGTPGKRLYSINSDGSLKWYLKFNGYIHSCTIGADGMIYVGSDVCTSAGSDIYAISPDGTVKWSYHINGIDIGVFSAPVIVSNSTMYVGARNGVLYAFKDHSPVVANFTVKNTSNPLVVGFNDSSVNSPSSWLWNFGDGSTSSDKNPVHTYTRSGTYLVTLTVGNVMGNSTKSFNVTVSDVVCPVVNISKHGGSFNTGQVVNLSVVDDSGNATIYYTLDGSNPTSSATRQVYTGGIMINSSTTLRFAGVDSSGNWGSIGSERFLIDKIAPKLVGSNPKNNAKSVSRTSVLSVKLSENLKKSLNWSKIYIKNLKTGKLVKISVSISGNTIKIKAPKRSSSTWYKLYIPSSAVKDAFGNNLAKSMVVKFKTR
jgi:outer membrane protein assembly factor BamB